MLPRILPARQPDHPPQANSPVWTHAKNAWAAQPTDEAARTALLTAWSAHAAAPALRWAWHDLRFAPSSAPAAVTVPRPARSERLRPLWNDRLSAITLEKARATVQDVLANTTLPPPQRLQALEHATAQWAKDLHPTQRPERGALNNGPLCLIDRVDATARACAEAAHAYTRVVYLHTNTLLRAGGRSSKEQQDHEERLRQHLCATLTAAGSLPSVEQTAAALAQMLRRCADEAVEQVRLAPSARRPRGP